VAGRKILNIGDIADDGRGARRRSIALGRLAEVHVQLTIFIG